jgi:hypothetical protein
VFTHTTAFRVEVRKSLNEMSGQNKVRFVTQQLLPISELLTHAPTHQVVTPTLLSLHFSLCVLGVYKRVLTKGGV